MRNLLFLRGRGDEMGKNHMLPGDCLVKGVPAVP